MASSHLTIVFARSVRVRRDQISGDQPGDSTDLMTIVRKGEERRIQHSAAIDLIIAESAYEKKKANEDRIAEIHAEVAAERKAERDAEAAKSKQQEKKAA